MLVHYRLRFRRYPTVFVLVSRPVLRAVAAGSLLLAGAFVHAGDWRDDIRLHDSAGTVVGGKFLRDRPLLLQFWESWCRSCGQLMSDMDDVAARYPAVLYLVVSTDDDPAEAWRRLESHPLFPEHRERFLHDSRRQLAGHLEVATVPTVVVIDANGHEKLRHSGHFNSSELGRLNAVLGEVASPRGDRP